jgi:broad specificity phosphatase PhoE
VPADRLHLVRHGEVHNPQRVLYGRLPNFRLSDDGRAMARSAAEFLRGGAPVSALYASPLQRTRESAEPFTELFGLEPVIDERVIEPTNVFEGKRMKRALLNPLNWRHLRDPSVPSWGEPYAEVVARMDAAMNEAWDESDGGDVVIVSHQLPIWVTHLSVAGEPLARPASPALRPLQRDELRADRQRWREVGYAEPATTAGAVDVGAV